MSAGQAKLPSARIVADATDYWRWLCVNNDIRTARAICFNGERKTAIITRKANGLDHSTCSVANQQLV